MTGLRLHFTVIISLAVSLLAGCRQPKARDSNVQQLDARTTVFQHLSLIEGVPAKIGEPHWDQHATAIISHGQNATPYLIESLTNVMPSKVVEVFQYTVGDLAHHLLCEIFRKPFIWPVADVKKPVGGYPEPTFQDYLALVNSPNGRQRLQRLWRETIPK